MSFFNKSRIAAMLTQSYSCPECGEEMEWEDDMEDSLICPNCGYSMDPDDYGDDDEDYDGEYPTKEEFEFDGDVGDGEFYDPEYDE